ncbi:DUF3310 domain-containing protein [bacterium]|nr:DUF3310 domain-containing protein [bacterium]
MSKHHHLSLNDATPEDWDRVSKPKHYASNNTQYPDLECIDAIKASMSPEEFRGYLKGNLIKYTWRYSEKDRPKEDLAKAQVYLGWLTAEVTNG